MGSIPESIIAGLGTASGLLPALGISLLLSQIITNVNWPYFFAGFTLAAYLGLPVVGTAALAFSIAFLLYFGREVIEGLRTPGPDTDKAKVGVLTGSDRRNMFFRSLTALATFNFERHLAGTFTFVMAPAIRKFFKSKEEIADALRRHLLFYNVQPTLTTLVMGSTAAMEEELVANAPSPMEAEASKEAIIAYKAGIMGPLAGVGDSLIWLTLMPLSFAIGASMAVTGNAAGPIVALLIFNIVNVPLKYAGIGIGYSRGIQFVEQLRSGLIENISKAATVVGLMVMGTALVNTVNVTTPIAINLGDESMAIQPVIDAVYPKLLTMLLTLLLLYLLRKRWNPVVLLLLLLVVGVVGKVLGILA
jgi:PTS system mannose-specific IID component